MVALPLYERQGSCQPKVCGSACCRFLLLETNPIYRSDPGLGSWLQLHGVEMTEIEGRTVARIPLPCSALDVDGACSLYDHADRPELCRAYPMTPLSLIGVEDVCTFRFTRPFAT